MPPASPPTSPPGRARRFLTRHSSGIASVALLAALPALLGLAPAVTLRGSRASVERAHQWAVARRLAFQPSRSAVDRAVRAGTYVRLSGGGRGHSAYRLAGVSIPYALPATASWVRDLSPSYRRACGQPLVVTSALRTTSRRLFNGSEQSVHPTGLAVDLRTPRGRCRTWLRTTLLSMERRGLVDATEERFPAHFHIVVFGPARGPARPAPVRRAPATPAKPAPVKRESTTVPAPAPAAATSTPAPAVPTPLPTARPAPRQAP